jgi:hypothetical protein
MDLRVDPIVVMMVPAMFASPVMTMDPMVAMLGPMARDPDHFVFTLPVTWAMAVVWLVAEFDVNSRVCRERGPESEARHDKRNKHYCFLNHINHSCANGSQDPSKARIYWIDFRA